MKKDCTIKIWYYFFCNPCHFNSGSWANLGRPFCSACCYDDYSEVSACHRSWLMPSVLRFPFYSRLCCLVADCLKDTFSMLFLCTGSPWVFNHHPFTQCASTGCTCWGSQLSHGQCCWRFCFAKRYSGYIRDSTF